MPRGRPRKTPAAAPAAAVPAYAPLARPILVDPSQLEIPDLPLLMKLQATEGRPEIEVQAAVIDAVPMLTRLVVGGLAGFKVDQLPAVLVEVFAQLGKASNPGN